MKNDQNFNSIWLRLFAVLVLVYLLGVWLGLSSRHVVFLIVLLAGMFSLVQLHKTAEGEEDKKVLLPKPAKQIAAKSEVTAPEKNEEKIAEDLLAELLQNPKEKLTEEEARAWLDKLLQQQQAKK